MYIVKFWSICNGNFYVVLGTDDGEEVHLITAVETDHQRKRPQCFKTSYQMLLSETRSVLNDMLSVSSAFYLSPC